MRKLSVLSIEPHIETIHAASVTIRSTYSLFLISYFSRPASEVKRYREVHETGADNDRVPRVGVTEEVRRGTRGTGVMLEIELLPEADNGEESAESQ